MADPIPFPGPGPAPEKKPEPIQENPFQGLVRRWREAAEKAVPGVTSAQAVGELANCADELEKLLSAQVVTLPANLVHRLTLASAGGYLTQAEAQGIVAAVSCVAALSACPDIMVRAELQKLDKQMERGSGGAIRVCFFANAMTRDAQAFMLAMASRPNDRKPGP